MRFSPLVRTAETSVYYDKLFGGYCVAVWRPCNVKLAKVISLALPHAVVTPPSCKHEKG